MFKNLEKIKEMAKQSAIKLATLEKIEKRYAQIPKYDGLSVEQFGLDVINILREAKTLNIFFIFLL